VRQRYPFEQKERAAVTFNHLFVLGFVVGFESTPFDFLVLPLFFGFLNAPINSQRTIQGNSQVPYLQRLACKKFGRGPRRGKGIPGVCSLFALTRGMSWRHWPLVCSCLCSSPSERTCFQARHFCFPICVPPRFLSSSFSALYRIPLPRSLPPPEIFLIVIFSYFFNPQLFFSVLT